MTKKQIIRKPLKDLNLTNRFLYDEVMEDYETNREALSIIFGKEIALLTQNESEKELRVSPLLRSIRMDMISMDAEGNVYNSEMQGKRKSDLEKRSRYNQALLDINLLEPGIPNYNLLNDSYIILIAPFDLFGHELYRYTFHPECEEVPGLRLEDGTTRIFLNTRGKNDDQLPKELVDFLHYLEDTTDERAEASGSERIRKIHERVRKVKQSEEVGVKYMRAWEEKYYEREEGMAAGRKEGLAAGRKEGLAAGFELRLISQVQKKIARGKSLEASAEDLEMDVSELEPVYLAVQAHPEQDAEEILKLLQKETD